MDLDAILDQALDDFEAQELVKRGKEASENPDAIKNDFQKDAEAEEDRKRKELRKMMNSMQNPEYGETLQNTLMHLSGTVEGNESVHDLFDNLAQSYETNHEFTSVPNYTDNPVEIEATDRELA